MTDDYRSMPIDMPIEAPPPTRRQRGLLPWIVSAILLAFALGLIASPWFESQVRGRLPFAGWQDAAAPAAPLADRMARQDQVIAAIDRRVRRMEARALMRQSAIDPKVLSEVDATVQTLGQRMDALDRKSAAALVNADRAAGMLLALAARRAIETGRPLGVAEGMLRDRFGATQPRAVSTLITAAQNPVTLAALTAEFGRLAPALRESKESDSLVATLRREIAGLFIIRRTASGPLSISDRVAFASGRLEMGDVAGALAQVVRLPAGPRQRAAGWIQRAQHYVAAREALDALETVALLAPPPSGTETVVPVTTPEPPRSIAPPPPR